eukprot:TRINITY_DN7104_c0_g1_i2.p1 TRINITY_DN7104_c0_g1~~TRINITY_DN7104_c0_g1_i2.p1  ORF type:complete len:367 (-),score=53.48 TRINITY_DN7104_c0_g1_i2:21-1067(-)
MPPPPCSDQCIDTAHLRIKPFLHQVGGHCKMMRSKGIVMKPLVQREFQFYERACFEYPRIIPYIAHYYGTTSLPSPQTPSSSSIIEVDSLNLIEEDARTEYLLLQDLTYKYRRPCILDMKIGTRQRGAVCASTTSSTLGIRICGMKVYRPGYGYEIHDRLYGRSLNASTMEEAIRDFLYDGERLRRGILLQLISKLAALIEVLSEDPCGAEDDNGAGCTLSPSMCHSSFPLRLYSSSLLLVFDGDYLDKDGERVGDVDIKMIDFAHAISKHDDEGKEDDGYVFGLHNLLHIFHSIASRSTCDPSIQGMDITTCPPPVIALDKPKDVWTQAECMSTPVAQMISTFVKAC